MNPLARRRSVAAAALLLGGCSDGNEPPPVDPCAYDQELEVTVSDEPTPLFTWTPSCGASLLEVWDPNHTWGWMLFTGYRSAQNPLRSGIRYGHAPPESLEPGPASPLVSGTTYTITLYRWSGDASGGAHFPVGSATFEP